MSAAEKFAKGMLHKLATDGRAVVAQIDEAKAQLAQLKGLSLPPARKPDPNVPSVKSRDVHHTHAPRLLDALKRSNEKLCAELAELRAEIDSIPAVHVVVKWRDGVTSLERLAPAPPRRNEL